VLAASQGFCIAMMDKTKVASAAAKASGAGEIMAAENIDENF
jgi:hypothetical protein